MSFLNELLEQKKQLNKTVVTVRDRLGNIYIEDIKNGNKSMLKKDTTDDDQQEVKINQLHTFNYKYYDWKPYFLKKEEKKLEIKKKQKNLSIISLRIGYDIENIQIDAILCELRLLQVKHIDVLCFQQITSRFLCYY